jgi:hypothetical protein
MALKLGKVFTQRVMGFLASIQILTGLFGFAGSSNAQPYSQRAADLMPVSGASTQTFNSPNPAHIDSLQPGKFSMGLNENGALFCRSTPATVQGTVAIARKTFNIQDMLAQPTYVSSVPETYQQLDLTTPVSAIEEPKQNAGGWRFFVSLFNTNPTLGKLLVPQDYIISPDDIGETCGQLARTTVLTNRLLISTKNRQPAAPVAATPPTAEETLAKIESALKTPVATTQPAPAPVTPVAQEPVAQKPMFERLAGFLKTKVNLFSSRAVEDCIKHDGGAACGGRAETLEERTQAEQVIADSLAEFKNTAQQAARVSPPPVRPVVATKSTQPTKTAQPASVAAQPKTSVQVQIPREVTESFQSVMRGTTPEQALQNSVFRANLPTLSNKQAKMLVDAVAANLNIQPTQITGFGIDAQGTIYAKQGPSTVVPTSVSIPPSMPSKEASLSSSSSQTEPKIVTATNEAVPANPQEKLIETLKEHKRSNQTKAVEVLDAPQVNDNVFMFTASGSER